VGTFLTAAKGEGEVVASVRRGQFCPMGKTMVIYIHRLLVDIMPMLADVANVQDRHHVTCMCKLSDY